MRFQKLLLTFVLLLLSSCCAMAQTLRNEFGLERGQTPAMEIEANYVFLHANAPPTQCGCFSANGGGGALVFNTVHGISFVGDFAAARATHVDGTSQNITIFNALGGVRYSYRSQRRYTPYVQALVGKSNEYSNYAAVQNVSALAASGGLGMSAALTRYIGWNVVQADYVYSQLPNGNNNFQNDLRLSSGITFRIGPR